MSYILCDILKSFITCRHNIDCRGCERLNNCRLLWKGESHWVRAAPRSLQFTDGGEVQRTRLTWHWPKYVPTAHNLKIWFQLAIQADLRTYIASKNGMAFQPFRLLSDANTKHYRDLAADEHSHLGTQNTLFLSMFVLYCMLNEHALKLQSILCKWKIVNC